MSNDSFWVTASPWARKRFRCDALPKDACGRPIRRIYVREGKPQAGYCYAHYLEAKRATESNTEDRGGTT